MPLHSHAVVNYTQQQLATPNTLLVVVSFDGALRVSTVGIVLNVRAKTPKRTRLATTATAPLADTGIMLRPSKKVN